MSNGVSQGCGDVIDLMKSSFPLTDKDGGRREWVWAFQDLDVREIPVVILIKTTEGRDHKSL